MSEYHFPVPGSEQEADVVLFIRRHWASYIGQFLLSSCMIIVPAIILIILYFSDKRVISGSGANFLVLGLSIYYLVAINVAFVAWVSFYNDIYVVCRDSIIDVVQEGFWGRKISQVSLLRVQDVSSNIAGFLPTIFGYGDVLVETAGEQTQNFLLKAIPNPQEVSAKILELHHEIVAKEERTQESKEGEGVLRPRSGFRQNPSPMPTKEPSPIDRGLTDVPQDPDKINPLSEIKDDQSSDAPPSSGANQEQENILKNDQNKGDEGEISKKDLDQGGEIDLH